MRELLDLPVPEGPQLEYKRDLYAKTDEQKREFLKDISGFANAFGGHLVIGIDEQQGIPTAIGGVEANPDEMVLWLEQIARTGLDPRIQGLRTKAVPLAAGKHCVVIRIPRSWHPPHQVTPNKRFWIRHSNSTNEASMDELRTLFSFGGDITQRAHQFREARLDAIPDIAGNPIAGYRGRLILHVIPLSALASPSGVDIAKARQLADDFAPFGGAHSPRFNLDGFICQNKESGEYTQLFRNGIIEAIDASIVYENEYKNQPHIGSKDLERRVVRALPRFVDGLRTLDVSPPLIVMISLQDVKGAFYAVGNTLYGISPINADVVRLPVGVLTDFGSASDYHRAIQPAFDALWNSAGRARDENFSTEGVWKG